MINDFARWSTKVTFEGANYYVRPTRTADVIFGVHIKEENANWAKGILIWHLNRSHPRTERQLRRALARCNTWCALRNVETMVANDTLSRLRQDKVLSR